VEVVDVLFDLRGPEIYANWRGLKVDEPVSLSPNLLERDALLLFAIRTDDVENLSFRR